MARWRFLSRETDVEGSGGIETGDTVVAADGPDTNCAVAGTDLFAAASTASDNGASVDIDGDVVDSSGCTLWR
jgi:hypothetical protein